MVLCYSITLFINLGGGTVKTKAVSVPQNGFVQIEIPDNLQLIGVNIWSNGRGGGFAVKGGANWNTQYLAMPYPSNQSFIIGTIPPIITISNNSTYSMNVTIGYIE